ncbi:hypothetical protein K438DRAFT_1845893 [Mycena galopus ATCC 62051]|nr:hypothetical protein K438DRAFT_1845893 [Mycena galopus ATCC 62051]
MISNMKDGGVVNWTCCQRAANGTRAWTKSRVDGDECGSVLSSEALCREIDKGNRPERPNHVW